jgi:hypothetical protein
VLTAAFCIAYLVFAAAFSAYSAYYVLFHVVLGIGERALPRRRLVPKVDVVPAPASGARDAAALRELTSAWVL